MMDKVNESTGNDAKNFGDVWESRAHQKSIGNWVINAFKLRKNYIFNHFGCQTRLKTLM